METTTYDTLGAMRAVVDAPIGERSAIYRERLIEPLREYWSVALGRFAPQMLGDERMIMKMIWEADLGGELVEDRLALEMLERSEARQRADAALRLAARTFESHGRSCSEEHVTGLLTLGNRHDPIFMEMARGYAGAQVPGYAVVTIWPNDYNLPRIPAAMVHEFNHRVRLSYEPWTLATSVGQYIVLEGLAESFARELYGEECVGPWVTGLNAEEIERSRTIIGGALDVTGFDQIRGYIFGDAISQQQGRPGLGLPYCAGYSIGYQVVQSYLQRTGKSATAATFVPYAEIIAESGFFA
ncbi:MAG TPA: DUF2268 domain-containing putative Zn-dependent protease [Ktedonobacteraceae bacterium]